MKSSSGHRSRIWLSSFDQVASKSKIQRSKLGDHDRNCRTKRLLDQRDHLIRHVLGEGLYIQYSVYAEHEL